MLRLLPADCCHRTFDRYTAAASSPTRRPPARCRFLRPVRRSKRRGVLHRLCREERRTPNRPLTFVFNGGPGAASAFLHLGLVGPRVLDFGPDAHDAARANLARQSRYLARLHRSGADRPDRHRLEPRRSKPTMPRRFWSVRSDADAMAKAIALYVAKNNRAGSPKYLFGESYGGFRAAKTARALQHDQGIVISGIVMLSPLLEGWLTFGDDQSALRAALQLPSLAAAELERKHAFSPEALAAAEKFAHDGLPGRRSPARRRKARRRNAFYERVAKMTGLPLDAVTQTRGFAADAYVKSLRPPRIRSSAATTRPSRSTTPTPSDARRAAPDPILDGVSRAYGGALASYARNELGFKTEMTYALLASDVTGHWDWQGGRVQASAEDDLRVLLAFGPIVPPADRARLFRHGHALRHDALCP